MNESDALIIGGGIAGAAAAFGLARRGRDVALVERGEIAGEASGVNAGQIGAAGWGGDVPDLEAYLTMGSLRLFERMQLDLGFDIEFRQSGALTAIHDAAQYDYMSARVREMRERGLSAEIISARQARAIEPEIAPDMAAYMRAPLRGQAHPAKATRAFAIAARREGARLFTGRAVVSATQASDGGWRVSTSGGDMGCQTLIIAAGAWSAKIGEMVGLKIPVKPVLGQMWATDPLPPAVFHTISSAESAYAWSLDDGRGEGEPPSLTHRNGERRTRHLYGRQRRGGEIIFGGDRRAAGFDKTVDPNGVEVNRAHAAEALPFLSAIPIARTWSGLMPFSLDGDPLIGAIPQRDNLYIVGGLSGSGFGRGPMAGELLAELIHSGNRHPVLAQADPRGRVTEAG